MHRQGKRYVRAVLTDVLPYETPLFFSNVGVFEFLNSDVQFDIIDKIFKYKYHTIPYCFAVKKDDCAIRELSIPHPAIQARIVDLYEKHHLDIISATGRSDFSLRYPMSIAPVEFDSSRAGDVEVGGVEASSKREDGELDVSVSFFAYKKFAVMHKFFDSYQYQQLELRFSKMKRFDISKCFPSIYTHTISWAVKNREYAKAFKKAVSFESCFDKLMQHSNCDETHGIIVGPEFSRIFAEVILQQIDVSSLRKIESIPYKNGVDYRLLRYVDDYFLFYCDDKIADCVFNVVQEELKFFKLYINESKTQTLKRPFLTPESFGKILLSSFINDFFNDISRIARCENKVYRIFGKISSYINEIKSILMTSSVSYGDIGAFFLSSFDRQIRKLCNTITELIKKGEVDADSESILCSLAILIEVLFYVYAIDKKSNSTFLICRTIDILVKFCNVLSPRVRREVIYKIASMCVSVINISCQDDKVNIEMISLLVACMEMKDDYEFSDDLIRLVFNVRRGDDLCLKDVEKLDYFSAFGLMYILKHTGNFDSYKVAFRALIESRLQSFSINNTEDVMFFFDSMSCPLLDEYFKDRIYEIVRKRACAANDIVARDYIKSKIWFTDWSGASDFNRLLKKKERSQAY